MPEMTPLEMGWLLLFVAFMSMWGYGLGFHDGWRKWKGGFK